MSEVRRTDSGLWFCLPSRSARSSFTIIFCSLCVGAKTSPFGTLYLGAGLIRRIALWTSMKTSDSSIISLDVY